LEPDTNFADAVAEYTRDWNPRNVAVGYDPALEAIVFCHNDTMLAYFETQGQWSTPLKISLWNEFFDTGGIFSGGALTNDARILTCLTLENRLYFVVQQGDDSSNLYEIFVFDIGLGGNWFIRSVARHGNAAGMNKTLRHARLIADLSSSQPMEWYWENSLHQMGSRLYQDNTTIEGYAASRLYLAPSELIAGKIRFEWTVSTVVGGETYATFASQQNLTKYGSPAKLPTTQYNLSSKLGWRISPGNLLAWYSGAIGTVWGTVLDGDVIRVDFEGAGVVKGRVLRNGVVVGTIYTWPYDQTSWSIWHGWKISIKTGGNIDVGTVYKYDQTGGFRFYKNFGGERGLAEIVEKTYTEDDEHTYPWERLNKTNIVTYNAEFFGDCGEQRPSVLYVDGWIPGGVHESLLTQ
jgi:hypothetical protein